MRFTKLYLSLNDIPYHNKAAIHGPSLGKVENTINMRQESTGFFLENKYQEISKIKVGASQVTFLIVKIKMKQI